MSILQKDFLEHMLKSPYIKRIEFGAEGSHLVHVYLYERMGQAETVQMHVYHALRNNLGRDDVTMISWNAEETSFVLEIPWVP